KPEDESSISGNQVYVLHKDRQGIIWAGTNYHGLNSIDPKTLKVTRYCYQNKEGCLQHKSVKSIEEDYLGNIWVGTTSGLHMLDRAKQQFYFFGTSSDQTHQGLLSPMVLSIFEDSQKRLWVGTTAGLAQFNRYNSTFNNISIPTMKSAVIKAITEDESGNLWMSTNNGLYKYAVADSSFQHFTEKDGLQGYQFNTNAIFQSKDGRLFFGGVNGFNYFYPPSIKLTPKPIKVHITDFWLFNQQIKPTESGEIVPYSFLFGPVLNLNHRQNTFSFEFVALNYSDDQLKYSYQIDGLQNEWIETGTDRKVSLTGLPPGDYTFRVRAKGRNGEWQYASNDLKIHIAQSFWKTPLAITGYVLLVLIIFGTIFWIILHVTHLRQRIKIDKINQENQEILNNNKLRFFTNISHDFRTPLTLMAGPIEALSSIKDPKIKTEVGKLKHQVDRLMNLIDQLLSFRKLETNHLKLSARKGNLSEFLSDQIKMFDSYAKQKDICLSFSSSDSEIEAWFDHELLDRIILNLLTNAFKYTPENGQITIGLSTSMATTAFPFGCAIIEVKDTGIGIAPEDIKKVFNRYYQVETDHEAGGGTGLGLSLVRELVELHGGEVDLKSQLGMGSTFFVKLPLGDKHINHQEVKGAISNQMLEFKNGLTNAPETNDKNLILSNDSPTAHKVLIIEDNEEVKQYIAEILSKTYQVETASNGKEGLEKVLVSFPDLVMSDVMMPEMNGIDFCRKLRQDIRISHIPIILLTARVSVEYQIEAFEIGADDYLSKPFNPQILKARVKNLIESRIQLREHFDLDLPRVSQKILSRQQENAFLENLTQLLEDHLDDKTLNVEWLGQELGMSRTNLFLKLKALTNLAPSEFIRNYKLKRGAKMLLESNYTVSEISYKVGFNSPSHFSTSFKRHFGESPSEYVSKIREK
ncbi:MAG: ATP-binding protein, partial [Bacteroidota bacterium]